jgi:hypothetical protein
VPPGSSLSFEILLFLPLVLLLPALIATLAFLKKAQTALGKVVAAERPGLWTRRILLAAPQAAVLGLVEMSGNLPEQSVVEPLLLGILLAWILPGFQDAVLGESGVQRGWIARRFADLEEWRLTGEHLRFRLHGEWTSVPCPPTQQGFVRETLLEVAPDRESRFQD